MSDPRADFMDAYMRQKDRGAPVPPGERHMYPYEPTLKDRMARWMLGDSTSPVAQRTTRNLIGSTGVGTTGPSIADLTPLGVPFALQDASRAGSPYDMATALLPGAPARRGLQPRLPQIVNGQLGDRAPYSFSSPSNDTTPAPRQKASREDAQFWSSVPYSQPTTYGMIPGPGGAILDPPQVPVRAVERDYPGMTSMTARAPLTHTIDGDPIIPGATVVGRRLSGGPDVAIGEQEMRKIADGMAITPAAFRQAELRKAVIGYGEGNGPIPQMPAGGGHVGGAYTPGAQTLFYAADGTTLNPTATRERLLGREFGKAIDGRSSLRNNVKDGPFGVFEWFGESGALYPPSRPDIHGELSRNYQATNRGARDPDASGLVADGIRAYMRDPNYAKTAMPAFAQHLRRTVNTDPSLSKHIQFNSIAAPVAAGLAISDNSFAE